MTNYCIIDLLLKYFISIIVIEILCHIIFFILGDLPNKILPYLYIFTYLKNLNYRGCLLIWFILEFCSVLFFF